MLQKREFRLKFLNATVKFIPEVVGGKEVYSVLNAIDEHCGYITEELLDTILKLNKKEDVENNIINLGLDVYSYSNKKPSILSQKIIIDSTLAETLPDIQLSPVTYTKEAKPLTIKVEGLFCIQNFGKNVSIDFNQDTISCKRFHFSNKQPTDIKISINVIANFFEGIDFCNLSPLNGKDNEINININTKGDYINIEDLTLQSDKFNYTGPLQISLNSGEDLSLSQMQITLPAKTLERKDYCQISSSKKSLKIHECLASFSEPGDSLEVVKGIDIKGVELFVDDTNKINGDLIFNGDIRNHGTLKIKNLKSCSNLHFFTRNCGFFELFDSTFNNGKKSILFQRGNNYFDNTTIENDGKSNLAFSNVNIKNSNLTNVSDLNNCNISNSEVLNFNLVPATSPKSKQVFSFGPTKEYPKSGFFNPGDRGILCSLKNTVVELDGANFFIDNTKGALHLNNSIIKGATLIETTKDEGSYSLSIDNSVLDNARISLARNDDASKDVTTTISNSEIKRQLNTNELKSIKNSVIDNSHFNQVSEINDSICESASLEGKSSNILNGYGHTSTPSDGQENTRVGQVINDLEIL
jgi:hypothetical protein